MLHRTILSIFVKLSVLTKQYRKPRTTLTPKFMALDSSVFMKKWFHFRNTI